MARRTVMRVTSLRQVGRGEALRRMARLNNSEAAHELVVKSANPAGQPASIHVQCRASSRSWDCGTASQAGTEYCRAAVQKLYGSALGDRAENAPTGNIYALASCARPLSVSSDSTCWWHGTCRYDRLEVRESKLTIQCRPCLWLGLIAIASSSIAVLRFVTLAQTWVGHRYYRTNRAD